MNVTEFKQYLNQSRIAAMKNKNDATKQRASVLGMLWAQAGALAKKELREVSDSDLIQAARRMIKDLRGNLELATKADRQDVISSTQVEILILEEIVPSQDNVAIGAHIDALIADIPAEQRNAKSMGRIIGSVRKTFGNDLDMSEVSSLIKERLNA